MRCETYNIGAVADNQNTSSEKARQRLLSVKGEPLFIADWLRPVFIHYEVTADILQRDVPFPLDLREGKAYVSLVAFTMRGMRLRIGGKLGAWLLRPLANNDFLNFRTYVHHRGERGIYFLTEWMNNRLSLNLGPRTFGLPYRFGRLNYRHTHETGVLQGGVTGRNPTDKFAYRASLPKQIDFDACPQGSLDEFLMERYTAFTAHQAARRFFRIWHPPWQQTRIAASISDFSLLRRMWNWFEDAQLVSANYSPGAFNVWMGRPHRVEP